MTRLPIPYFCRVCKETNSEKFYKKVKHYCIIHILEKTRAYHANQARNNISYYRRNTLKAKISSAKTRSRKKKLDFDIDEQFVRGLLDKQNNRCIYTGIEFIPLNRKYSMSIDKIDPTKGYTKDNIQLTGRYVNTMKARLTESEFFEIIKLIINNRKL